MLIRTLKSEEFTNGSLESLDTISDVVFLINLSKRKVRKRNALHCFEFPMRGKDATL